MYNYTIIKKELTEICIAELEGKKERVEVRVNDTKHDEMLEDVFGGEEESKPPTPKRSKTTAAIPLPLDKEELKEETRTLHQGLV